MINFKYFLMKYDLISVQLLSKNIPLNLDLDYYHPEVICLLFLLLHILHCQSAWKNKGPFGLGCAVEA